ncbi:MAG: hypothetical protein ABI270_03955 [Nitrosospira sp.]
MDHSLQDTSSNRTHPQSKLFSGLAGIMVDSWKNAMALSRYEAYLLI